MLKNKLKGKYIGMVLFLVIALLLAYTNTFQSYFITKTISFNSFIKISALVVIVILILVDVILIHLLKTKPLKLPESESKKRILYPVLYYFILMIAGLLGVFIIRKLYGSVGMGFQVDTLFDISIYDLFWFIIYLNIFISYFLFSLYLLIKIEKFNLEFKEKLLIVLLLLIVIVLSVYFFTDLAFVFPLFLSFLIYLFVLDIYMDNKIMNSTWMFTFMILISGLTALIIFLEYSKQISSNRVKLIKSSLFERDNKLENNIKKDNGVYTISNDKYYFQNDTFTETEFLSYINKGYYQVDSLMYFRPLSGDYLILSHKIQDFDKYIVSLYFNKLFKPKNEIIVLFGDQVISNNTIYSNIPIPEENISNDSVSIYNIQGLSYLKYQFNKDLTVYQVEKIPSILKPFSLFSMLFVIMGLIVFIISLLNHRFNFLPQNINIRFTGITSLRNRIQFSIIGLIILSFFALGILTFYYLINNSEQYQKDIEKKFVHVISNELNQSVYSNNINAIQDMFFNIERDDSRYLYYYNSKGELVQDKRRKHSESKQVPLDRIDIKNVKEDKIYSIEEVFLYSVFSLDRGGEKNGYVVNYFKLNSSIKEVSTVLSDFLNLYVLLFLLAGAIAIALANSITRPIDILGDKLEFLNLNENNEVLKWEKNDEIGKLISIYNTTVKKLEESAKIITKIERDSAWREMAKQVAHEIKNPLTPLKLNIQYLQGIVKNSPDRAVGVVEQIAPGLLEQINNLDKIATEFADFAKMPSASNEKVHLNEIVKAVHDFFRKREDLDFKLYVPINDLIVFADKNHLVSILNNIIKNAIQAIPTDRHGKIVIDLYKEGDNSVIKITDNGSGIPEEMKSKVFSPNFTTKTSGTGLGLAISVNMIQAFNGNIYFETELDKGTSFFVEIPLMRLVDNFPNQKIVSLDD